MIEAEVGLLLCKQEQNELQQMFVTAFSLHSHCVLHVTYQQFVQFLYLTSTGRETLLFCQNFAKKALFLSFIVDGLASKREGAREGRLVLATFSLAPPPKG